MTQQQVHQIASAKTSSHLQHAVALWYEKKHGKMFSLNKGN